MICQGDVFWIGWKEPYGSEPGYRHPYVVVQNDLHNRSRLATVIVCAITSNLKRAAIPGNVRLRAGEAGLPKASVVNVSQVFTVDKTRLTERLGRLSPARAREILRGLCEFVAPRDIEDVRTAQ